MQRILMTTAIATLAAMPALGQGNGGMGETDSPQIDVGETTVHAERLIGMPV
ncbi:hypothetical protein [Rhodovulum sp. ES.010]|uniref:hypothetical protein n=1 Tax=Rhodovulum sp. ES.010 TaxID=1882821 RepID=UPI001587FAB4|nr:hypothetical protein [Rhodovulum sp. ES.010]